MEEMNTDRILITFATRTGSTRGVAEAIGAVLAETGAAVDVLPMQEVSDLTKYTAVVAGSAIQAKQWLPEALDFVRANRNALSSRPFAAFLVCMTLAMRQGESYRGFVSDFMAPVRALVRPVSEGLFAGSLDIGRMPSLFDRLQFQISVWAGVWSPGDHRDWDAIRTWARDLRPRLLTAAPAAMERR